MGIRQIVERELGDMRLRLFALDHRIRAGEELLATLGAPRKRVSRRVLAALRKARMVKAMKRQGVAP